VGYSALGKLERVMPWRLVLEQYAAIFCENRIDNTVLSSLAAEDLKAESDKCFMR
jgi:hypothetical protein